MRNPAFTRLAFYEKRMITDAHICACIPVLGEGEAKRAVDFVQAHQSQNAALWTLFVKQFAFPSDDADEGWRGEYWGKMMRGACEIARLTRDEALYAVLQEAVEGLLALQDDEGRISTYSKQKEFTGWDLWARKYVMLGMQYFYEICSDEALRARITESMIRQADYILARIGEGVGKRDICLATTQSEWTWGGLNSSSILEPMVRLYSLTGDKRYLDFATYLIKRGGSSWGNVFLLALEDKLPPYRYPVRKAYEMASYFCGVLEYYRVTGDAACKTAFLNFVNKVLATDFTIIGCGGCTHELFDYSARKQTKESKEVMQETCVTVTLMATLSQAYALTGRAKYADAVERAYYNAMLGSINFKKNVFLRLDEGLTAGANYRLSDRFVQSVEGFTFDSYSPLTRSRRNRKVGGYKLMENGAAYGCCACIGSSGVAALPLGAVMRGQKGFTLAHFVSGRYELSYRGKPITLTVDTDYPYGEDVRIFVQNPTQVVFSLRIRIPYGTQTVWMDGEAYEVPRSRYLTVQNPIGEMRLSLRIPVTAVSRGGKTAIEKGNLVYAALQEDGGWDKLADELEQVEFVDGKGRSNLLVTFASGDRVSMTDYASAGAEWDKDGQGLSVWLSAKK